MELHLHRDDISTDRTIGMLLVDRVFECFVLEPGERRIPAGRYEVVVTRSERFKRQLPLLVDVPGFDGIRMHAGNTSHDTRGCLVVGMSRVSDSVLSSRLALAALQPKLAGAIARGDRVWITIVEERPEL